MQLISVTEWYGLALGSLFALWLLVRFLTTMGYYAVPYITAGFLRHVAYLRLWSRLILLGGMSPFELLLLIIYLCSNGFCMAYRATSRDDISSRAAILSTINMIPLLVGSRLSMVARFLGLANRTYLLLHRWVGLLSAVQGVVHTILAVSNRATFQWNSSSLYGFIVSRLLS
jgi:Ferric reductase like transmembrane component